MENDPSRWVPVNDDDYGALSVEMKRSFVAWAAGQGISAEPDVPEGPLHYKWGFLDRHLTRWTRRNLDELYLELYPAKVMAEPDELDEILAEAAMFVTFLAETGLADNESEPVEVLLAHLDEIAEQFRANMTDSSRYSFGKAMWTDAASEGVRLNDPKAVEAYIARFNARPRAERDAILGGGLKSGNRQPVAGGRFTPPGTAPRPSSAKRRKRR